jgi:Kef-type K+ transport system membrane component KefB
MFSDPYNLIIFFCIIILLSYLFNIISERLKIPSVILLIGTGLIFQQIAKFYKIQIPSLRTPLELLGIIGLIMIVLEGAMDLKITKKKKPIIIKSFLAGGSVLFFTAFSIAGILVFFGKIEFRTALAYAVPMGIISSAIAIPTASNLDHEKKEFITYESTFSDILGIMMFNYVIADELLTWGSLRVFGWSLLLIIHLSLMSTLLLLWLSKYLKSHLKVLPILSVLVLLYAFAKLIHLPSLFLILVFGLVINNISSLLTIIPAVYQNFMTRIFNPEKLNIIGSELKSMTGELAFLIRTFFFLLFGFTIDLSLLLSIDVLVIGSLIILVILIIRYAFLKFILKANIFPELFIAPRGLITILLFYSIPARFLTGKFNEGVLIFVIIGSSLIMMLGIIFSKKEFQVENELEIVDNLPDRNE